MQLTDRLSKLTRDQQYKVMERVFAKMSLSFGSQALSKWSGMDMRDVYQDWAGSMQNLSLGAIQYGIEQSKKETHPPNQGEFIKHCSGYRASAHVFKIESKLTPEQIAKNKLRIAEIAKNLAGRKGECNASAE